MNVKSIIKKSDSLLQNEVSTLNIPQLRLLKNRGFFQFGLGYKQISVKRSDVNTSCASIICTILTIL